MILTGSPLPTQICSRDKMHLMAFSKTLFFHIQPISSDMVQTLEIDRMIAVDCDKHESQDLVVSLQHSGFLSQCLRKLSPSQREIIHSIIATSHVTRVKLPLKDFSPPLPPPSPRFIAIHSPSPFFVVISRLCRLYCHVSYWYCTFFVQVTTDSLYLYAHICNPIIQ